jgi:hypothetical protein
LLTTTATAAHSNSLEATHTNQANTEEELEEPSDTAEIEMATHSMNNNKSPGIDNIPALVYRKGGGLLLNKIHRLIKVIWREEKVLTD